MPNERTPLFGKEFDRSLSLEEKAYLFDQQNEAAIRLSQSLLSLNACEGAEEEEFDLLRKSLNLNDEDVGIIRQFVPSKRGRRKSIFENPSTAEKESITKVGCMAILAALICVTLIVVIGLGETTVTGMPKRQPVGEYQLVEAHVC